MELREPVVLMLREPFKWTPHENQSTDARHWGGVSRSSVEIIVMMMERRSYVRPFSSSLNWLVQEEVINENKTIRNI